MEKQKIIKIRITNKEYNDLTKLVEKSDSPSISSYVRNSVFSNTKGISVTERAILYGKLQEIKERHSTNQFTQKNVETIFQILEGNRNGYLKNN
jgi:hypothetical protein